MSEEQIRFGPFLCTKNQIDLVLKNTKQILEKKSVFNEEFDYVNDIFCKETDFILRYLDGTIGLDPSVL